MADNTRKIIEAMNNLAATMPDIKKAADSFDKLDISELVDAINENTQAQNSAQQKFSDALEAQIKSQEARKESDKIEEKRQKESGKFLQQSSKQIQLNRLIVKDLGALGKALVGIGKTFNIFKNAFKKFGSGLGGFMGGIGGGILKGMKDTGGGLLKKFGVTKLTRGFSNVFKGIKLGVSGISKAFSALSANPYVLAFKKTFGYILGKMFDNFKMGIKYGGMFVKFFVGLPLKITGAVAKIGNQLREQIVVQIGNAVEQTKEFADATSGLGKGIQNISDMSVNNLSRFKNVRGDLVKLFGTGIQGVTTFISVIQKGMEGMNQLADTVGASIAKNEESALFFVKATRSMGMGAAEIEYITAEAVKNGESIYQAMDNVLVSISNTADSFGLDKKKMSKNFFELRKDIINFGHLTNDELTKTTARLTQMGLSMKEASAVFGKIDTFESAAQTSAMLSQTFGMNLDALQLLRAEKPEEIIEQFRDAMLSTGRAFDDLNRHEKALMQTHTGLTAEALKLTMNYRNMGMSFAEIQQKMKEDDPTVQQIKNLELMSGSLKEIKATMAGENFFYSFANGVAHTIKTSSGLTPHLLRVSETMEDFFTSGLTLSKDATSAIGSAFKPVTNLLVEMVGDGKNKKGLFNSKRYKTTFESFSKSMGTFLGRVFSGEDLELLQYEFSNNTSKFFSFSRLDEKGNIVGEIFKTGGKFVGQFLKAFAAIGPGIIQTFGDAFSGLVDLLDGGGYSIDGGESIKDKMMKIFGLNTQDANAIQNTFNKLVDTLVSKKGPFMRLFVFINQKLVGLATDFGKALSEGATSALPFATDYLGNKVKGLEEAAKLGLKGKTSVIEDLANKMAGQTNFITDVLTDNEGELAKLGGKMQYVLNQMEKEGTVRDKALLKEFFERSSMSKSELLDVKKLEDNYEALQDLAAFMKGKRENFNMITLDVEKINGVMQNAKNKLLGPGMMATIKNTPDGVKVLQHAPGDVTLTAKPSEISYAGLTDLSSTSVANMRQRSTQNNNSDARPVSLNISIPVDGKVLTQVALDHDILAEAMKPGRSRFRLADGVVLDASGNPIEGGGI